MHDDDENKDNTENLGWEFLRTNESENFSGSDGSWGYVNDDGSGYYSGADGSWGSRNTDGSGYYSGADGSWGSIEADGSSYYSEADGINESTNGDSNDEKSFDDQEASSLGDTLGACFLQALFEESCKIKMANFATPKWRKLQRLAGAA